MQIPVIKIQADNEQGFILINKSDYDEKSHKLYKPEKKTAQKEVKKASKKAD